MTQLGIDYLLSDTLIPGAMAQYDWMDDVSGEINQTAGAFAGARVEDDGWMIGSSENTVNPLGLYEDAFETDRFMARASLTSKFESGNWRVRPQANLTHFEETQGAYTDSLNIAIPEQTLTLGRITMGPEVAWTGRSPDGGYLEPTSSISAVWDYETADLLNEAGLLIAGNDDVRADARVGIGAGSASGLSFRLEAGFAGLGVGDFEANSARIQLRSPFGARGRGGAASLRTNVSAFSMQQECDDPSG